MRSKSSSIKKRNRPTRSLSRSFNDLLSRPRLHLFLLRGFRVGRRVQFQDAYDPDEDPHAGGRLLQQPVCHRGVGEFTNELQIIHCLLLRTVLVLPINGYPEDFHIGAWGHFTARRICSRLRHRAFFSVRRASPM